MEGEGRKRVVIEQVTPEIDGGRFPIKRVTGENVVVSAGIFADGHDTVAARVLYRAQGDPYWKEVPMRPMENDRWTGKFLVEELGTYYYTVEGWVDCFKTWQRDLRKKCDAGQDVTVELRIGAALVDAVSKKASLHERTKLAAFARVLSGGEDRDRSVSMALSQELTEIMDAYPDKRFADRYEKELEVRVDRGKALFSAWYELFARSASPAAGRHGTFKDCEDFLPELSRMGFDVLYLPPIHPIGETRRKGKNNVLEVSADDVGSPWAIGSEEGGHKAVHPPLGTLEDFERLVAGAKGQGIDIAMDLAFQCSPDHPYVKEHPEWFIWRPDGTIQFAENPPKRYEDIISFNFETEDWKAVWEELKSIVVFWIKRGVHIFRVDNPHTKPFPF